MSHNIKGELIDNTPARIISQIQALRSLSDECQKKIADEGSVVRNLKGDVIAHPAIKIMQDAMRHEAQLLDKYAKKTSRKFEFGEA